MPYTKHVGNKQKMKQTLNILLLILTLISCKNQSKTEIKTRKIEVEKNEIEKVNESSKAEQTDYIPTELDIQKTLPKYVKNAVIPDS